MAACLWLSPAPAQAAHSLVDIQETARQFIDESQPSTGDGRREIEIRPLDPRLQLAECDQPLKAFSPASQQRGNLITMGIRCQGSSPWKIYVSGRVRLFRPVAVLSRPLPKGAVIQPMDVEFREQDVGSLNRGFYSRQEELTGMSTKRPLNLGEILTPNNLQAPVAVSKGQRVTIRAEGHAFHVGMSGEAMRDGGIGERIQVKNLSSGRLIEALIQGPGEVLVLY